MSSLVSDFIITPVLRQARRFSAGFAAEEPPALQRRRTASTGAAILEGDEDARIPDPPTAHRRSQETPSDRSAATIPPSPSRDGLRSAPGNDTPADSSPSSSSSAAAEPNRQLHNPPRDEQASPAARATWPMGSRATPLPEDDGMGDLRRKLRAIQAMDVRENLKAQLMHQLLMEKYTKSQQVPGTALASMRPESPTSRSVSEALEHPEPTGPLHVLKFWNPLGDGSGPLDLPLTEEDIAPTFAPDATPAGERELQAGEVRVEESEESEESGGRRALGCEHYRRNVKLQCADCERWYTCRFCHDAAEDHVLPRKQTKHMLCMLCGCAQRASDSCVRCGQSAAYYYCGICKLWNDDPNKPIYHCPDCGLCRVGQGLGKDFFHCKKCMTCISTLSPHKCVERSTDCDCPICGDYLFNSTRPVVAMPCGHSIHRHCFQEHMKTSYRCPLCSKSCVNMEYRFRTHDLAILTQPMPAEYRDARAIISCNDCRAKSQTAYHWLGLKCSVCQSYNTTQLQLVGMPRGGGGGVGGGGDVEGAHREGVQREMREGGLGVSEREWQRVMEGLREGGVAFPSAFASQMLPLRDFLETGPGAADFSRSSEVEEEEDDEEDDDDDDEDDLLDLFWGRDHLDRGNGVTSAESAAGVDEEEEESSEEEEEEDCEEDDDDEEDEIVLLGHR
ncbi:RING finger and CHY zinc finger domain-containing protein 1 [Madurella fahalii]|uniref:RING finger and CHY zinc finger domain-containing protein 1 n=1 Tax=Madurella fahalii TaxID=1157608 RepID=A0ABQ0G6A9_9PEZI